MVTNDASILEIKHRVMLEVARLAWEGKLEEKRDEIPYQMIPGPRSQFRCCIYKEREIIRQRGSPFPGRNPPMWCRSSARPARNVPSHHMS